MASYRFENYKTNCNIAEFNIDLFFEKYSSIKLLIFANLREADDLTSLLHETFGPKLVGFIHHDLATTKKSHEVQIFTPNCSQFTLPSIVSDGILYLVNIDLLYFYFNNTATYPVINKDKFKVIFFHLMREQEVQMKLELILSNVNFKDKLISFYVVDFFRYLFKRIDSENILMNYSDINLNQFNLLLTRSAQVNFYKFPEKIEKIAISLGYSLNSLDNYCFSIYGVSFGVFIIHKRLLQSFDWLNIEKISLSEAARRLYYRDIKKYYQDFEKYIGYDPRVSSKKELK